MGHRKQPLPRVSLQHSQDSRQSTLDMSETDARMTIAEIEVVVVGGGKGRLAAHARNRARTYTNTTSPAVTCAVSYAVSVFETVQGSNEHLREVTEPQIQGLRHLARAQSSLRGIATDFSVDRNLVSPSEAATRLTYP